MNLSTTANDRPRHLVANRGRNEHPACMPFAGRSRARVPPVLVDYAGQVTCKRCKRLLVRMYGPGRRIAVADVTEDGSLR